MRAEGQGSSAAHSGGPGVRAWWASGGSGGLGATQKAPGRGLTSDGSPVAFGFRLWRGVGTLVAEDCPGWTVQNSRGARSRPRGSRDPGLCSFLRLDRRVWAGGGLSRDVSHRVCLLPGRSRRSRLQLGAEPSASPAASRREREDGGMAHAASRGGGSRDPADGARSGGGGQAASRLVPEGARARPRGAWRSESHRQPTGRSGPSALTALGAGPWLRDAEQPGRLGTPRDAPGHTQASPRHARGGGLRGLRAGRGASLSRCRSRGFGSRFRVGLRACLRSLWISSC